MVAQIECILVAMPCSLCLGREYVLTRLRASAEESGIRYLAHRVLSPIRNICLDSPSLLDLNLCITEHKYTQRRKVKHNHSET
jgi:hypothetical protein